MTRIATAAALARHYSRKLHGKVTACYDETKRAYCIHGTDLPAAPEMRATYPNGWTMLDYIKGAKAQAIARAERGKE